MNQSNLWTRKISKIYDIISRILINMNKKCKMKKRGRRGKKIWNTNKMIESNKRKKKKRGKRKEQRAIKKTEEQLKYKHAPAFEINKENPQHLCQWSHI